MGLKDHKLLPMEHISVTKIQGRTTTLAPDSSDLMACATLCLHPVQCINRFEAAQMGGSDSMMVTV